MVVLLLLTFRLLLLSLWKSVIVLCFPVRCSIAIILVGKRELVALLNLSSWCLAVVERLFLEVPWGPGGGGGTLIFSYIRRLGPFLGVQNSEFQYFFGFSEK